ncbi:MAG TPA: lysophospholipid acyltransferase family protein [Terriglobales bacterium]|nr:lysophospholipid acyltransferase family protein [Terriglobales bacterium]
MGAPENLEQRFTLLQRIQLTLVSWIVPLILRLIGCTLRATMTYEEGSIQNPDEGYPGIFPFWHRCVLPATWLYRHQHPAVMTSRSLDGEYIARVISRFGFLPVRGSSTRGGQRALLEMNKLLREGHAVAFTIDGPRGPRYVAKRGPVLLARMSGVAITAFFVAVERAWVLKTWDALMIPKPFSRIHVRFAKKIFVPPDADDVALERYHADMQAALERITAFAEAQFAATRCNSVFLS